MKIGVTEQLLEKRLYSRKSYLRHRERKSTTHVKHSKKCNHNIDLENISILTHESNRTRRKIIIGEKQAMNFKSDSVEIQAFYAYVLADSS